MVQSPNYHVERLGASLVGVGIVGYSGWLSWDHSHEISAPLAAVVGAGLFHFSEVCFRSRRWLSGPIFMGLGILAIAIALTVVLSREATRHDRVAQSRASENTVRQQAQLALIAASAELAEASKAASSECSSGRKARCLSMETREMAARQREQDARQALAKQGAPTVVDPSARRIAAVFGVSEASVATFQPMLVPVWLELTGVALLTFGLSRPKAPASPKPKTPAQAPSRSKRTWRNKIAP